MPVEYLQHYEDLMERAIPISLSRHYTIGETLWALEKLLVAGTISETEHNLKVRALHAEEEEGIIEFKTENTFSRFCVRHRALHDQYLHEQEHAEIYRKHNIPYRFGFLKIISDGKIGFIPWVRPLWPKEISRCEQLKITIESLENAREHSQGDKQDIRALREILAKIE